MNMRVGNQVSMKQGRYKKNDFGSWDLLIQRHDCFDERINYDPNDRAYSLLLSSLLKKIIYNTQLLFLH